MIAPIILLTVLLAALNPDDTTDLTFPTALEKIDLTAFQIEEITDLTPFITELTALLTALNPDVTTDFIAPITVETNVLIPFQIDETTDFTALNTELVTLFIAFH
ncbi:TPA: hypothetical protein ACU27K_002693, partial [Staphylococcus aureus]